MEFIDYVQRKTDVHSMLAEAISSLDMGVPFRIVPNDPAIEAVTDPVPYTVTTEDGYDLDLPIEWTEMKGYSGQYGYHGPVMHPSEAVSTFMVEDMCTIADDHPGTVFAVVPVALREGPRGHIGWAVIFRTT